MRLFRKLFFFITAAALCLSSPVSAQQPQLVLPSGENPDHNCSIIFPDGKLAAIGSEGQVRIWEAATGSLIRNIALPGKRITSLEVSLDGMTLAAQHGKFYSLIDTRSFLIRNEFRATAGTFSKSSPVFIYANQDSIFSFDYRNGIITEKIRTGISRVFDIQIDQSETRTLLLSEDSVATVWNLGEQKILSQFREPGSDIIHASIDPSGERVLVSYSSDRSKVYSLSTHAVLFSKDSGVLDQPQYDTMMNGSVYAEVFNPEILRKCSGFSNDGKFMMLFGGRTARIYDAKNFRLVREYSDLKLSLFSPDSRHLFLLWRNRGSKSFAKVVPIEDADPSSSISIADPSECYDPEDKISFSKDGKILLYNLGITDVSKNKKLAAIRAGVNRYALGVRYFKDSLWIINTGDFSHAWNFATGSLVASYHGTLKFRNDSILVFSNEKDSTWILSKGVHDWHTRTLAANYAGCSVNGQMILLQKKDSIGWFFAKPGKTSWTNAKEGIVLPGSRILLQRKDSVVIFRCTWSAMVRELAFAGTMLAIYPDSSQVLVRSGNDIIESWSIQMRKKIFSIPQSINDDVSVEVSSNGKFIAVVDRNYRESRQQVSLYNASTGNKFEQSWSMGLDFRKLFNDKPATGFYTGLDIGYNIYINPQADVNYSLDGMHFLSFSPDYSSMVFAAQDSFVIVNAKNGEKRFSTASVPFYGNAFAFSERYFIQRTAADDGVDIYDLQSRRLINTWKQPGLQIRSVQSTQQPGRILIGLASAGSHVKMIVATVTNGDINKIGEIPASQLIDEDAKNYIFRNVEGSRNMVIDKKTFAYYGSFDGDGDDYRKTFDIDVITKISGNVSGDLVTFDKVSTGDNYYKLLFLDDRNYLVIDTNQHFDGTAPARKQLYFSCGTEIIELNQVKEKLWVPGLAKKIGEGQIIPANTIDICGLTPAVEPLDSKGSFSYKITPRRGGLGEVVLYVNGIEVKRVARDQLKKEQDHYIWSIPEEEVSSFYITGASNPVRVIAYTNDNKISSRGVITEVTRDSDSPGIPNLYAVMIGVSDYKGDELDLRYAAKDAADLSSITGLISRKLLNIDGKEHVFLHTLTTDSAYQYWPSKQRIRETLAEVGRQAKPNDILLLFFSGHGVMHADSLDRQFYFITSDASAANAVTATADVGISMAELTDWIKPAAMKAQKRILIFDACNSGGGINNFIKVGNVAQGYTAARNDERLQQAKAIDLLNDRTGLFILAASASDQNAYEFEDYAQGVMTYSLLKTVKEQSDLLSDGKYLSVSRWFNAAEKMVRDLSLLNGTNQQPQLFTNADFNIGVVDGEVTSKIRIANSRPLVNGCFFQNQDPALAFDNLELSEEIQRQLIIIADSPTSSVAFSSRSKDADAYSLSGRYVVTGNEIKVMVNLIRHKTITISFEVKGPVADLPGIANRIGKRVNEYLAGLNKTEARQQ